MTRDEAIQLLSNIRQPFRGMDSIAEPIVQHPDRWIEAFEALGMLKLDEPKIPREKFKDAMRAQLYSDSSSGMRDALNAFDAALK